MKNKLLISFSGGKTSAYMTWWILNKWADRDNWEILVVFANTGKEREETLEFVNNCDKYFGFNTVWLEGVYNKIHGVGTRAKIVEFITASRNGEPFDAMMQKHGIPNRNAPFCSKELKRHVIKAYAKHIGWNKYFTAIGIRVDEIDRMSENRKKDRIIYPLISFNPTRREQVNVFWQQQIFKLELKGYEGNCDACWKKSLRKLLTIAKENPQRFDWWGTMEKKYENYTPESRKHNAKEPYRFFRQNLTAAEIIELSKHPFKEAKDDSNDIVYQPMLEFENLELDSPDGCEESCEAF